MKTSKNLSLTDLGFNENIILDPWQEKVLEHEGDITIRSGRQCGKSTVISIKAKKFALENPGKTVLIVAASQRQSSLLFEKVVASCREEEIKEKPTLTKVLFKNGSKIYCLPTGRTGYFIRGFTIDLLIADEAAYIADTVWIAIIPMLAVTGGHLIMLSTPFGKTGYYYDSFKNKKFKQFIVSAEDCKRIPKDFLDNEKRRLTRLEYAQEYLAKFVESYNQYFSSELIHRCCKFTYWKFAKEYDKRKKYYLGIDVARFGGDENAFVVMEDSGKIAKIVHIQTTKRVSTLDTIARCKKMDEVWKFSRIYIDDGGVGGGVYDALKDAVGRKIIGINNASRSVSFDKNKKLLKEDIYSHTLILMEQGKIEFIDDPSLKRSMQSVIYHYSVENNLKIKGNNDHICEALVRACWGKKGKSLRPFVLGISRI